MAPAPPGSTGAFLLLFMTIETKAHVIYCLKCRIVDIIGRLIHIFDRNR